MSKQWLYLMLMAMLAVGMLLVVNACGDDDDDDDDDSDPSSEPDEAVCDDVYDSLYNECEYAVEDQDGNELSEQEAVDICLDETDAGYTHCPLVCYENSETCEEFADCIIDSCI